MLRRIIFALQLGFGIPQCVVDKHIGQRGDFSGSFRQRRQFQYVPQHDADVFPALEAGEDKSAIGFERTGAKAGQTFIKLFAGETLVKISLAQKRGKQIGILHQSLAQEATVSEHDQRIVSQGRVALEHPQSLGRIGDQAIQQAQRRIRVRTLVQEGRQARHQRRRQPGGETLKVLPGGGRFGESDARKRRRIETYWRTGIGVAQVSLRKISIAWGPE